MFPNAAARRALVAFCTPRRRPQRRVADRDDGGARRDTLRVDGRTLCVYRWGDTHAQPYVLFAHGWDGQALQFRGWIAALRTAGYAVVAFDQPGHGRSGGRQATLRDFVAGILAVGARCGPTAAVIGHARGALAAAIALRRGLVAERAVLIAAEADHGAALARFARARGLPRSAGAGMASILASAFDETVDEWQVHRIAARIGRPALVVHDLLDRQVPWDEGERYARHWPDARLLTTSGLGHEAIAQDHGVIADCLRFLRGEAVGVRVVSSPNLPYGVA